MGYTIRPIPLDHKWCQDTHQRLAGRPVRSRKPQGVLQEGYALLLAHGAVRAAW